MVLISSNRADTDSFYVPEAKKAAPTVSSELSALGWLDGQTVKEDQRTHHQAELLPSSSLLQGNRRYLQSTDLVSCLVSQPRTTGSLFSHCGGSWGDGGGSTFS